MIVMIMNNFYFFLGSKQLIIFCCFTKCMPYFLIVNVNGASGLPVMDKPSASTDAYCEVHYSNQSNGRQNFDFSLG